MVTEDHQGHDAAKPVELLWYNCVESISISKRTRTCLCVRYDAVQVQALYRMLQNSHHAKTVSGAHMGLRALDYDVLIARRN